MSTNNHIHRAGSNQEKSPGWEFRDQHIPARLFFLLRDEKDFTATDFLILSVVNSMVRPQGDKNGLGCWAANDYIGKCVGCHPNYVSSRLSVLEEKKLLLIVWHKGQRYLEAEWSRTGEEREELAGSYGESLREAYRTMFPNEKGGLRKTLRGGKGKPEGGVKENLNINNMINTKGKKVNTVARKGDSVNGFFPSKQSPEQRLDAKRAERLYKAVLPYSNKKGWQRPETKEWPKQFAKLRLDASKELIDAVLEWYTGHVGDEFVPEVFCARSFRMKFNQIARAMEKSGAEPPKPSRILFKTVKGNREVVRLRSDDED